MISSGGEKTRIILEIDPREIKRVTGAAVDAAVKEFYQQVQDEILKAEK